MATDWLAVYGAGAATAALLWQSWTWWHERRLSLVVIATADVADTFVGESGSARVTQSWVDVRVVNRGGRIVRVEEVGFVRPAAMARADHASLVSEESPEELPRHDGVTFRIPRSRLGDRDLTRPLDLWLTLTTGERLYAHGVRLSRPSMADPPQGPVRLRRRWAALRRSRLRRLL